MLRREVGRGTSESGSGRHPAREEDRRYLDTEGAARQEAVLGVQPEAKLSVPVERGRRNRQLCMEAWQFSALESQQP